jgi:hypothetical protein
VRKKGRYSFLKKRTKNLLLVARAPEVTWGPAALPETDNSFLVLFCKKEQFSV